MEKFDLHQQLRQQTESGNFSCECFDSAFPYSVLRTELVPCNGHPTVPDRTYPIGCIGMETCCRTRSIDSRYCGEHRDSLCSLPEIWYASWSILSRVSPNWSITIQYPVSSPSGKYNYYVYQKPWIRCPPYLLGILGGYFLAMKPTIEKKVIWPLKIVPMLLAVGLAFACITANIGYDQGDHWRYEPSVYHLIHLPI